MNLMEEKLIKEYYDKLNHPLRTVVEKLKSIILETDKEICETIKWNSPCFYYSGEMKPYNPKEYKKEIVVLNLHKKDLVLLVFPTGTSINDTTGLLSGDYKDSRKIAKFSTLEEVITRKNDLQSVIRNWLSTVDK
jgi:hypothetical protein